ncbi:hypothetical protein THERMOS_865 [Bathymodiolus thermophilus thioautotrophic gill symbiont]|uniref:Uncharacterized protein n=1 Tax=Bathymodiolus thermophilus thioautotrophic gill symbiont TaxID=2360 RepID=A0A8H9CGH2_9GAMM|nr:hypothetical protein THERMOS_865 [Bathymodiolus thermophilus thioautotrophic gill symbiont]
MFPLPLLQSLKKIYIFGAYDGALIRYYLETTQKITVNYRPRSFL